MAITTDTCPVCRTGTLTIEAEPVVVEDTGQLVQRVTDLFCPEDCDPDEIRAALKEQGVNLSL